MRQRCEFFLFEPRKERPNALHVRILQLEVDDGRVLVRLRDGVRRVVVVDQVLHGAPRRQIGARGVRPPVGVETDGQPAIKRPRPDDVVAHVVGRDAPELNDRKRVSGEASKKPKPKAERSAHSLNPVRFWVHGSTPAFTFHPSPSQPYQARALVMS